MGIYNGILKGLLQTRERLGLDFVVVQAVMSTFCKCRELYANLVLNTAELEIQFLIMNFIATEGVGN